MYKDKIVIITGANGGIGKVLVEGYAKKGFKVIAVDINNYNFNNDNIDFYEVDLKCETQINDFFIKIKSKYKKVHILINNASIAHFNKSIFEIKNQEFNDIIDVNIRASFIFCKEFVKLNQGEDYGRIINISSTRFNQNEANWEAYGTSKGGIISLTNSLCVSLSNTPITVNAISPGWIENNDYDNLTDLDQSQHPSGRVGNPKDILNTSLFLTDIENDFINGANIIVDGGMTKRMIYF